MKRTSRKSEGGETRSVKVNRICSSQADGHGDGRAMRGVLVQGSL